MPPPADCLYFYVKPKARISHLVTPVFTALSFPRWLLSSPPSPAGCVSDLGVQQCEIAIGLHGHSLGETPERGVW